MTNKFPLRFTEFVSDSIVSNPDIDPAFFVNFITDLYDWGCSVKSSVYGWSSADPEWKDAFLNGPTMQLFEEWMQYQ